MNNHRIRTFYFVRIPKLECVVISHNSEYVGDKEVLEHQMLVVRELLHAATLNVDPFVDASYMTRLSQLLTLNSSIYVTLSGLESFSSAFLRPRPAILTPSIAFGTRVSTDVARPRRWHRAISTTLTVCQCQVFVF